MIKELAEKYNFNPEVLQAMEHVPRHLFVDKGLEHLAYKDKPLPIAARQTISQPYTVAMQTHLLDCRKQDKVLEIGTGCGYQAAVLMAMGFRVYSVERIRELYLQAQKNLANTGFVLRGWFCRTAPICSFPRNTGGLRSSRSTPDPERTTCSKRKNGSSRGTT